MKSNSKAAESAWGMFVRRARSELLPLKKKDSCVKETLLQV